MVSTESFWSNNCHTPYDPPRRMTGTEARQRLAELLTQELGVSISPEAVKRLIERRWSLLSPLAHACHDDYEPPASAENAARAARNEG